MCGITGLANCFNNEHLESITTMTTALIHRGPDSQGIWMDAPNGVALGHQRLSILDLSPTGEQPMSSDNGRFIITFNGEIYNFKTLRQELTALGYAFKGSSDTEVLLKTIKHYGLPTALERITGMFAFALWDRDEKKLYLARDRFGEKPLYYGWINGTFLFASELKALTYYSAWSSKIDRNSLSLYTRYGYIPAPYTIYEKIWKVVPGTFLELQHNNRVVEHTFWSAKNAAQHSLANPYALSFDDAINELDTRLKDIVTRQYIADVPVGAFLSGGIDSSSIISVLQSQIKSPINTFSIGTHNAAYDEAHHARKIAQYLGTNHTELYVSPTDCIDVIQQLPKLYDEPFADYSQIPTFLVSRLAKQKVTVCLSGDGGDELFGGYNRYLWAKRVWNMMRVLPAGFRKMLEKSLTQLSVEKWDNLNGHFIPFLPEKYQVSLLGDKIFKMSEIFADSGTREELYHNIASIHHSPRDWVLRGNEYATRIRDKQKLIQTDDFVQWMMFVDTISYLQDDILAKVDRASMGVSLEVRAPFLDHHLFEFAWRLPAQFKINQGKGKHILRQLLYRYVPQELVDRPKMGFGIPIDRWMKTDLRDWAESLLDETSLNQAGYFNTHLIRKKWDEHISGQHNWYKQLWNILMFQGWLAEQAA